MYLYIDLFGSVSRRLDCGELIFSLIFKLHEVITNRSSIKYTSRTY